MRASMDKNDRKKTFQLKYQPKNTSTSRELLLTKMTEIKTFS